MSVADEMRARLEASFSPTHLEIQDDSESHRGHAGFQEGGESHFNITMRAADLGPMSRIERHRAVQNAIGADIIARIHALSMDLAGDV